MPQKLGLVIDMARCTGCQTCVLACRMEHGLEGVSGIRVDTLGGVGRDTAGGCFPHANMQFLPIPCMHCERAPCIESCPDAAIYRRDDGIVVIDETWCSGCGLCLESCVYEVMVELSDKPKVWKCDLCAGRIDEGLEPFCVVCCGMKALRFVDLAEVLQEKETGVSGRHPRQLQPDLNTEPRVYYRPLRPARAR